MVLPSKVLPFNDFKALFIESAFANETNEQYRFAATDRMSSSLIADETAIKDLKAEVISLFLGEKFIHKTLLSGPSGRSFLAAGWFLFLKLLFTALFFYMSLFSFDEDCIFSPESNI